MANPLADLRRVGTQLRRVPIPELGRQLVNGVRKHDVTGLAAQFAYSWIFAIPPLLLLIFLVAAIFDRFTSFALADNLRSAINQHTPADLASVLNRLVDRVIAQTSGGAASFGSLIAALVALWSGSNAIGVLMKACNRAYGVEEDRPWLRRRLLAIGLTLLVAVLINAALLLLVFGQGIGTWLADRVGLGGAFGALWAILRWPLGLAALAVTLAILYYAAPNVDQSFRWISPGSALAAVLWLVMAEVFGIYLRVGNPGNAYGAVGGAIVLLSFLYLTGLVFLLGAELNAVLERRYDPATIHDLATDPKAKPDARAEAQRRAAGTG